MKAVFTTKQTSAYDDVPEVRYHFPKTYLSQVERTLGDLIVYYEPRRTSRKDSSRGGRQSYFAIARVTRIETDPRTPDHYYAYVADFLSLPNAVPFRADRTTFESMLLKADGSTNKGAFGPCGKTDAGSGILLDM